MITDSETNHVYLSGLLPVQFKKEYSDIILILNRNSVSHSLLQGTKDIWCRDNCSIQVEKDRFVQFQYNPSYLKRYPKLKSDPDGVNAANGIEAVYSSVNLDGGNVVKSKSKVIITDRIFDENPTLSKKEIIVELERLLEVEVIIIPQFPKDFTGHADGMVRFLDEHTILSNDISGEPQDWKNRFLKVIRERKLEIEYIPVNYSTNELSAVGIYVNYLQVGELLVFPVFGLKTDDFAFKRVSTLFPDSTIETININDIGKEGGLMNCITWNNLK